MHYSDSTSPRWTDEDVTKLAYHAFPLRVSKYENPEDFENLFTTIGDVFERMDLKDPAKYMRAFAKNHELCQACAEQKHSI